MDWLLVGLALMVAVAIMLLLRANRHRPHQDDEAPTLNTRGRDG